MTGKGGEGERQRQKPKSKPKQSRRQARRRNGNSCDRHTGKNTYQTELGLPLQRQEKRAKATGTTQAKGDTKAKQKTSKTEKPKLVRQTHRKQHTKLNWAYPYNDRKGRRRRKAKPKPKAAPKQSRRQARRRNRNSCDRQTGSITHQHGLGIPWRTPYQDSWGQGQGLWSKRHGRQQANLPKRKLAK